MDTNVGRRGTKVTWTRLRRWNKSHGTYIIRSCGADDAEWKSNWKAARTTNRRLIQLHAGGLPIFFPSFCTPSLHQRAYHPALDSHRSLRATLVFNAKQPQHFRLLFVSNNLASLPQSKYSNWKQKELGERCFQIKFTQQEKASQDVGDKINPRLGTSERRSFELRVKGRDTLSDQLILIIAVRHSFRIFLLARYSGNQRVFTILFLRRVQFLTSTQRSNWRFFHSRRYTISVGVQNLRNVERTIESEDRWFLKEELKGKRTRGDPCRGFSRGFAGRVVIFHGSRSQLRSVKA